MLLASHPRKVLSIVLPAGTAVEEAARNAAPNVGQGTRDPCFKDGTARSTYSDRYLVAVVVSLV